MRLHSSADVKIFSQTGCKSTTLLALSSRPLDILSFDIEIDYSTALVRASVVLARNNNRSNYVYRHNGSSALSADRILFSSS